MMTEPHSYVELDYEIDKDLIDYVRWRILRSFGHASVSRSIWSYTQDFEDLRHFNAPLLPRLHDELEQLLVAQQLDIYQLYSELAALDAEESAVILHISCHVESDEGDWVGWLDKIPEDRDESNRLCSDMDFPIKAPWMPVVTEMVFAEARASIKDHIQIAFSSAFSSVHLLDMPDEILSSIFLFVTGKPSRVIGRSIYDEDLHAIAKVRLTCRRFRDVSSCLLLRTARVSMNSASLLHLDQLSRHAIFGKTIEVIAFDLSVYDSGPANDFNTFAMLACSSYDQAWPEHGSRRGGSGFFTSRSRFVLSEENRRVPPADSPTASKASAMVKSWRQLFDPDPSKPLPPADLQNIAFLHKAHEEYQRRYQDQRTILENGSFVHTIAAAFVRMPRANTVAISDSAFMRHRWWSRWTDFIGGTAVEETLVGSCTIRSAIFDMLTRSRPWLQKTIDGLDLGPVHLLVIIPIAIHKGGKLLSGIDIAVAVQPSRSLNEFNFLPSLVGDLLVATKNLTHCHVSYCNHTSSYGPAWPLTLEIFSALFLARFFASGSKLRTIGIHCDWRQLRLIPSEMVFDDNEQFAPPISPELRRLELIGMVTLADHLLATVKRLHGQMEELILKDIQLLDGSWVAVLDALHHKSLQLPRLQVSFQTPSGAEIDTIGKEATGKLFSDPTFEEKPTLAEEYANSRTRINPLREHLTPSNAPDPTAAQGLSALSTLDLLLH